MNKTTSNLIHNSVVSDAHLFDTVIKVRTWVSCNKKKKKKKKATSNRKERLVQIICNT